MFTVELSLSPPSAGVYLPIRGFFFADGSCNRLSTYDLNASYFQGRIKSELPFFPGAVNTSPIYSTAILDFLKVANDFSTPIFISHVAIVPPVEISQLPRLVSNKSASLDLADLHAESKRGGLLQAGSIG